MNVFQENYLGEGRWTVSGSDTPPTNANLVLCFGHRDILAEDQLFQQVKQKYPIAEIVFSSTAGEINNREVLDDSMVLTAIEFEDTPLQTCKINIQDFKDSYKAGLTIVDQLPRNDLKHVFIVSDGQEVNGSELVRGLQEFEDHDISVTGGLAGDGVDFNATLVGLNSPPEKGAVIAIGFYGNRIKIGCGSQGGWDAFGPERLVTKSKENILYELDGISALGLYKKYLGEAAEQLPSSALYYPLAIKSDNEQASIVRTILSVNEEEQSMVFAGDIPERSIARLMMHNSDKLIEGAEQAAQQSLQNWNGSASPELVILVSCVGRKIVLGQSVDEEVAAIRDLVGPETMISGFYSYGEIAPQKDSNWCALHNQTMTITIMTEL